MGASIARAGAKTEAMFSRNRARKHRKVAQKYQRRMQILQRKREAREALRQGMIQRAEVVQGGINQGVGNSSAVQGAVSSIQSQTADNIFFASRMMQLSNKAQHRLNKATRHENVAQFHDFNAEIFGSMSNMGGGGGFGGGG